MLHVVTAAQKYKGTGGKLDYTGKGALHIGKIMFDVKTCIIFYIS